MSGGWQRLTVARASSNETESRVPVIGDRDQCSTTDVDRSTREAFAATRTWMASSGGEYSPSWAKTLTQVNRPPALHARTLASGASAAAYQPRRMGMILRVHTARLGARRPDLARVAESVDDAGCGKKDIVSPSTGAGLQRRNLLGRRTGHARMAARPSHQKVGES